MTAINIDKWRTLNEGLFKGYVLTYDRLSKDNSLNPNETLIDAFEEIGIKGSLTVDGYGSAYTIAREIGIYYEDNNKYYLSNMAKAYVEGKLTYPDFLKYYCLNIEFLINDEVIHPFKEILQVLKNNNFDKDAISQRTPKLIPLDNNQSAIDCLRLFLNRCVEAELLSKVGSNYGLNFNYDLLKGSINISNYSVSDFENTFIKGNASLTQKNIVTKLIEREITNLFKDSFYIKKDKIQLEKTGQNLFTDINNAEQITNRLDLFINWFVNLEGKTHNYLKDSFSDSIDKLKENLLYFEELYKNEFNSNVFSFDSENKESFIKELETNLYKENGAFFEFSSKKSNHMPRAILGKKNYLKFIKERENIKTKIEQIDFKISSFQEDCENSGLSYNQQLITRYIASLATKAFVLLSGLSGSGKTKLAQAFAQWIAEDDNQYCIVPVGADWTNREPLLGYVNALDNEEYILPENGALKLLIEANKEKNKTKPYFLILDEMNLSHVERYFADFLSVMESKDLLKLHSDTEAKGIVTSHLNWPKNLFIVGTVNIDETTYMFSPKVLDRANVIEFRVNTDDISKFLDTPTEIDFTNLNSKGARMGENFMQITSNKDFNTVDTKELNTKLILFFEELKKTGAEFGYRTATEIHRLYNQLTTLDTDMLENDKIDIAIMQKLLPKLHGSRRKLCPILETLASFCVVKNTDVLKAFLNNKENIDYKTNTSVLYPLSLEKITRMYKGAVDNGFASYAEA